MSSPPPRRPPRTDRAPLTREQILDAALAVIDRDGLEGLNMRKLGAEVGVEAMSLYNHVGGKEDVLDGVVALLWHEVETRMNPDGSWQQQARALARAIRDTAHAHPHGYPLVLTRGVLPSEVIRLGGHLLASLREAGFGELAPRAMLTIASHATSQALAEVSWYGGRAADGAPSVAGEVAPWPVLVDIDDELPQHDAHTPFAFGLELLIEALGARLDDSRAGEP